MSTGGNELWNDDEWLASQRIKSADRLNNDGMMLLYTELARIVGEEWRSAKYCADMRPEDKKAAKHLMQIEREIENGLFGRITAPNGKNLLDVMRTEFANERRRKIRQWETEEDCDLYLAGCFRQ